MNYEVLKILEYCNKCKLKILSLNTEEENVVVENNEGEAVTLGFQEIQAIKEDMFLTHKYLVVRNTDITKYLDEEEQDSLRGLVSKINCERLLNGKSIYQYVVVNSNAPYIDEVIELMQKNK